MIAQRASRAATAMKAWPRPAWNAAAPVGAVVPGGDDGSERGDPEGAADLPERVVGGGRGPAVAGVGAGDTATLLIGEFISPAPSPMSANRHPSSRADPPAGSSASDSAPRRRQQQPRDHDRGGGEPGRQPPGDRAEHRHQDRHRQERQPGPQRRVVLVLLQVDAVEVQDPVQHDEVGQRGQVRPDEAADCATAPAASAAAGPRLAARRWLATNPAAAAAARRRARRRSAVTPSPGSEDSISPYTSAPAPAPTARPPPGRSAGGLAGRPYRAREMTRRPSATVTAPRRDAEPESGPPVRRRR